ncbi:MAG: hypothetical protein ABSB35_34065 [Bryobacteraceae bacterium]|jgi:hypothetical protein
MQTFISRFIEPHLPSPERLTAWSKWIVEGVESTDVVIVRRHGGLSRGILCDIQGLRVLPSDLSPVWAVQQAILHSDPPTDTAFGKWVLSLPLEHNAVRKRKLDLLNVAGFHTAHLIDVAAHRNAMLTAKRPDVLRSVSVVELHPMNVLWVPKPRWSYWGASVQLKAHFAGVLKRRVPDLWDNFIRSVGGAAALLPKPDPDFQYFYTDDDWGTNNAVYHVLRSSTVLQTPQIRQIVALLAKCGSEHLTEAEVRRLLENGKVSGEFPTTQDAMKVFLYYRRRMKLDGVLTY